MTPKRIRTGAGSRLRNALPRTLDGFVFDPNENLWRVPTPTGLASFNFNNLPGASEQLCQRIKEVSAALLASISPKRAEQALSALRGPRAHFGRGAQPRQHRPD